MLELHVGELVADDLRGHLAPQPRRLEDVRLVDGSEPPSSLSRQPGGDAHHAPHLVCGVDAQIGGTVSVAALLAEVEAAGELADDHQIDVAQHFRLHRR